MAILGLGTDIVEIARIEAVIARRSSRPARAQRQRVGDMGTAPAAGSFSGKAFCGERGGGESPGDRYP